jgi:CubicO group peptidase (beta-lactamase class C family)
MTKTLTHFICILILLGCTNQQRPNQKVLESKVQLNSIKDLSLELSNQLSKEFKNGTFEGSVLITSNETELLNQSYGWADKAKNVKNSSRAISDMGSIAKTFTAVAVLQLIASGELKLTTTLGAIFPHAPIDKKQISIEQLLTHSSGLDNFHNESDFDVMSKDEAIHKILRMPLIAQPDKKIVYSNAAYTLLAAVIEHVTSQTFQSYVQQNLINPLSLKDTGFYQDLNITQEKLSKGYGGQDSGATTFAKGLTWALMGAGGMVTSREDLHRWLLALVESDLISKSTDHLVLTPGNDKWLLGSLRDFSSWGPDIVYMGGSTEYGYTSAIFYIKDYDVHIVMLLNAYGDKYENATHQQLAKKHVLPILKAGYNLGLLGHQFTQE